jgi:hypothetical protein
VEIYFDSQPAGHWFALESGWIEAVLANGFDGFLIEGYRGVVVFPVGGVFSGGFNHGGVAN